MLAMSASGTERTLLFQHCYFALAIQRVFYPQNSNGHASVQPVAQRSVQADPVAAGKPYLLSRVINRRWLARNPTEHSREGGAIVIAERQRDFIHRCAR